MYPVRISPALLWQAGSRRGTVARAPIGKRHVVITFLARPEVRK
jgi:hypothetical protein